MRILPFLCLLAALASCNAPVNPDQLIGPDHLPSTLFVIDPTRDTTLTTPKGAILKIPSGALDAGGAAAVTLEVKEAYSVEDMLRGRLLTRSKGALLSSGGMIYINVAGGVNATLRKPIAVSIPSPNLQQGMKRYKGVKDKNGIIDWVDPSPLDSNAATARLQMGKRLFQTECAACHALKSQLIGPAMAYITARRPYDWLVKYTRNNTRMLETDEYACWLYNRYNKTPMNTFPSLTDEDMAALYGYIESASFKFDSSSIKDDKLSFDSCRQYKHLIDSINLIRDSLTGRRNGLIRGNGPQIIRRWYDSAGDLITGYHTLYVSKPPVSIVTHTPVYYQFQVDSFGWYNVDLLADEGAGFFESELKVLPKSELGKEASIFLIIPGRKMIQQGGLLTGAENEYGFLTGDGKIALPQGVEAYIVALGEQDGKVIFGKTRFIISRSQSLPLDLGLVSKEEFNKAIDELQFDRLVIRAQDSKNAAGIRSTDSALAALKKLIPANCDCNCGARDTALFEQ